VRTKPVAPDPHSWHSRPVPKVYFDERIAARYDADYADMFEPAVVSATVDFLAELTGSGTALELGIGTGRIALPLSGRGVRVHGIDLSTAMVARLRSKPGGDAIGVTIGDFTTARVGGTFALAYLVFNTIMGLTTQDAQVECFRNVAAHLEPGGRFAVEVMVPELRRLPPGQDVVPFDLEPHPHHRRPRRAHDVSGPVRLARRTRPDGAAGRDDPARAVEWLEPRAVHRRQHRPRLGLGEGGVACCARCTRSGPRGCCCAR